MPLRLSPPRKCGFVVWTIPSPFPARGLGAARLVSTPSRKRFQAWLGIAISGFPDFEQFYAVGFPMGTQPCLSPLRLPFRHAREKLAQPHHKASSDDLRFVGQADDFHTAGASLGNRFFLRARPHDVDSGSIEPCLQMGRVVFLNYLHTRPAVLGDLVTGSSRQPISVRRTKADVLPIQPVLGRADVTPADHRLAAAKLPPRDQPHGPAARAGHDGDERVLGMTQLRLILQDENRSRVHSFGNPFFQKLQVG